MLVKVVNVEPINSKYSCVFVEDIREQGLVMNVCMDNDPSLNNLIGKNVSIHTTVTEISNSNFNYEFPEGTLGTHSKGNK